MSYHPCERCGGTGVQAAGLWNPDTGRYDDLPGVCRDCDGTGLWPSPDPVSPPSGPAASEE